MTVGPGLVGVYGGGRMGAGIAHAFALAGREVVVVETSAASSAAAYGRIEATLRRAEERGALSGSARSVLERVRTTSDPAELSEAVLVVEAVPEDADLKVAVLASVEHHAPRAWLASNTSSLSIDRLAAGLSRPERLVGLHFFNPVPVMKLVEVVRTISTSDETFDAVYGFAKSLGKEPIKTHDNSGFIVNRLLVPYLLDAVRALEEGVGSREDIDKGMELGCGHPMGPLKLLDFVGLDTTYAIAEIMWAEYREKRFAPPPLLKRMVLAGRYGKKSGRGFYEYGGDR